MFLEGKGGSIYLKNHLYKWVVWCLHLWYPRRLFCPQGRHFLLAQLRGRVPTPQPGLTNFDDESVSLDGEKGKMSFGDEVGIQQSPEASTFRKMCFSRVRSSGVAFWNHRCGCHSP